MCVYLNESLGQYNNVFLFLHRTGHSINRQGTIVRLIVQMCGRAKYVVFKCLCSCIYSRVYMCECSCQDSSHGVEESDDLGEETVSQSDRVGPNASVPSAGWQESA